MEARFGRRCDHIGLWSHRHVEFPVQPRSVNDWEIETTNARQVRGELLHCETLPKDARERSARG